MGVRVGGLAIDRRGACHMKMANAVRDGWIAVAEKIPGCNGLRFTGGVTLARS